VAAERARGERARGRGGDSLGRFMQRNLTCAKCDEQSLTHPDNTARHPLPTPPRFPAGANWVQSGRAIALTNGGGPKLFPTAKRFSSPTIKGSRSG
jgi:hypothetical protein